MAGGASLAWTSDEAPGTGQRYRKLWMPTLANLRPSKRKPPWGAQGKVRREALLPMLEVIEGAQAGIDELEVSSKLTLTSQ